MHILILPSSLSRYSSVLKTKRIFQILWCIFEGRTNRPRPFQPFLKNWQNGTFWPMHVIQKYFRPNYFFWSVLKVLPCDFIQKMSEAPPNWVQIGLIYFDLFFDTETPTLPSKKSLPYLCLTSALPEPKCRSTRKSSQVWLHYTNLTNFINFNFRFWRRICAESSSKLSRSSFL